MNARVVWLGGLSAILALAAAYLHLSPGDGLPGLNGDESLASSDSLSPRVAMVSAGPMLPRLPAAGQQAESTAVASSASAVAEASAVGEVVRAVVPAASAVVLPVTSAADKSGDSAHRMRASTDSPAARSPSTDAPRKSQREAVSAHQAASANSQAQRRVTAAERSRRFEDGGVSAPVRHARVLAEEGDSYVSPSRGASGEERPGGRVWVIPKLHHVSPDVESHHDLDAEYFRQEVAGLVGLSGGLSAMAGSACLNKRLPG